MRNRILARTRLWWLTRWCQIKFIFSDLLFLYMNLWSSGISHMVTQTTRRSSVQYLEKSKFWFFEFRFLWYFHMFWDIYTHIWTEISQPLWFGGCRRWAVNREVLSSIPCRQNCGTWSTQWSELKWVRLEQWRS